jgi:hypothetical protein
MGTRKVQEKSRKKFIRRYQDTGPYGRGEQRGARGAARGTLVLMSRSRTVRPRSERGARKSGARDAGAVSTKRPGDDLRRGRHAWGGVPTLSTEGGDAFREPSRQLEESAQKRHGEAAGVEQVPDYWSELLLATGGVVGEQSDSRSSNSKVGGLLASAVVSARSGERGELGWLVATAWQQRRLHTRVVTVAPHLGYKDGGDDVSYRGLARSPPGGVLLRITQKSWVWF